MALSLAAGTTISPLQAAGRGLLPAIGLGADYYPPALTGMRGTHDGAFEVAHAVAREGRRFQPPGDQTDATYDLVVLGGGLSGLAAAWYFREEAGSDARILILENHDDFGGHAKQVEFNVDGRRLISYGGSQTVDGPGSFPAPAKRLLRELRFDADAFSRYFNVDFYRKHMSPGIYFDGATYGESRLVPNPIATMSLAIGIEPSGDQAAAIRRFPVQEATRQQLIGLFTGKRSYVYQGATPEESIKRMATQSYEDFVRREHGLGDEACGILRDYMKGVATQLGADAINVITAATFYRLPVPGLSPSLLNMLGVSEADFEPYIHHFPGGNSGLARLLVRAMIPGSSPGERQEDIVLGRFDYSRLDLPSNTVRLRLNSTGVDVRHAEHGQAVDVTYVQGGKTYRVRGRHSILACYNNMLPFICPEMADEQKEALGYASKTPFAWTQVALRNWRAIEKSGYGMVYSPGAFISEFWMDFPVSMGGYEFPKDPDDPMVVTAFPILSPDRSGLPPREQFRIARTRLLGMPFSEFERGILDQLDRVWGPYGMEPRKDVAAITVNRWPHGYAYSYDPLWDPYEYDSHGDVGPHVTGRAQMNRISIANSDAGAMPLMQTAFEQGHRAVQEQLKVA